LKLLLPVHDEVIRKNEARREKAAAIILRKKTKLRELILSAKVIKDKMKSKTYKLNRKDLLVLVRYKDAGSSGMTKVKTRVIIKNIQTYIHPQNCRG
jgi:hypothetical protein